MTHIALFPGQGVQTPGMHAGLEAVAPDVFSAASDALGIDVVQLCATGESGDASLSSTRWAQPAILVCGVAAARALAARDAVFDGLAGHSLGEYTALVVAGALELEDAVALVALRAEAMDRAAAINPGGMVAVLRVDREGVDALCARTAVSLAGDNAPGQLVISGSPDDLDRAIEDAKAHGATCRRVDVAGAFHSPAMEPAVGELAAALHAVTIVAPPVPVWSSTTADRVSDPDDIRSALVRQLTEPVRFRETVLALHAAGATSFCDAGPGSVLAGMVKRTVPGVELSCAAELLEAVRT